MFFSEPAIGGAGDAEEFANFFCIATRLQSAREDDHINRDASLLACQRIFHLNDEFSFFVGVPRRISDLCHFAAHKESAFFQHTLIELIVGFISRTHVDVEVVNRCASPFVNEMRELQSLHAANDRAIVVEVPVA